MSSHSEKVPKAMADTFAAVTAITDAFCREHLNDEYAQLIRFAAAALCRKRPSPLAKGTPLSWAAGITHAVGMVNFLHDPAQSPHMPPQALYQAFGVSQSNALAKSKQARDLLDIDHLSLEWCRPSLIPEHPMAWMIFLNNGMMVDARQLEREEQVILYQAGLIPYVHADREPDEAAARSVADTPAVTVPPTAGKPEPARSPKPKAPAVPGPPSPQLELF